jgi:hypothetical protein
LINPLETIDGELEIADGETGVVDGVQKTGVSVDYT